jgi:hypothetical protein
MPLKDVFIHGPRHGVSTTPPVEPFLPDFADTLVELQVRVQMCVSPRKSNVDGFGPPGFSDLSWAFCPNSFSRVLSGCSVNPYFSNLFLLFDTLGALIWIGSYVFAGYVFSDQLELAAACAIRMGSGLVVLTIGLFAAWIIWKCR